ncbi:MAG: putative zinc-binding metallopeptidase [Bradyrhizobium sp.]
MRQLHCPKCRTATFFELGQCATCETPLTFNLKLLSFEELKSMVPCANRTLIGCNWSVDDGHPFCHSCRLTRIIPNLGSDRNVALWKRVERAKRRLVYDLSRLDLPLAVPSGPNISFDILSDETAGFPILTGHLAGLITLNLAEADDAERESRRIAFREPYRTLLGHFRHEVGHFYWEVLVGQTNLKSPFQLIFGYESRSYEAALIAYHQRTERSYDRQAFISEYATSHPWEDWAETFAHFLHIVATLDSAAGLPLSLDERSRQTLEDPYMEADFDALLTSWRPVAYSINELNRSMGLNDAYPFQLSPAVRGKLHFVHMAILNFRQREAPGLDIAGAPLPDAIGTEADAKGA